MLKASITLIVFLMIMTDIVTIPVLSQQEDGVRKIVHPQNDSGDGFLANKKTVRVQNDLSNGIFVYLHCKSKDDDLGEHVLEPGQFQEWSFRDNIGHTTLFWCNMFAYDLNTSFEIYWAIIEENICLEECYRSVREDGLYFYYQFDDVWVKRVSWSIPA